MNQHLVKQLCMLIKPQTRKIASSAHETKELWMHAWVARNLNSRMRRIARSTWILTPAILRPLRTCSLESCLPSLTLGGRTTSHPFSNTILYIARITTIAVIVNVFCLFCRYCVILIVLFILNVLFFNIGYNWYQIHTFLTKGSVVIIKGGFS